RRLRRAADPKALSRRGPVPKAGRPPPAALNGGNEAFPCAFGSNTRPYKNGRRAPIVEHCEEGGNDSMKVAILGGDGFVGWPTSLHLSDQGHDVHIIDNLSRRWIDTELGVQSLTPMDSIQERTRIWHQ